MPTFGPFEVVRELESGEGATVYEARKDGDRTGQYAVKVFHPEELVAAEPQAIPSELEPLLKDIGAAFTERVNLQKQAAATSPYFAPILAGGHDERGAWYATQFYARSVKGIIERFGALAAPDLFRVVQSVVKAAVHLKRTAGRSHGNLKPGNVFIAGTGRPRSSRIVVADPLPGGPTEAAAYEIADLRRIGELIYQCVLQRKVDFTWVLVPIEATPEWTRLFGNQAKAWLELCNRLLGPQLRLDNFSLEQLDRDLARLKPKLPLAVVLVPAAAAVLLLGIGGFLLLRPAKYGLLLVTTDPPGAEVGVYYGDGSGWLQDYTKSAPGRPVRFKAVPPGAWELRARFPDLEAQRLRVSVVAGKTVRTNVSFPYGRLIVLSQPPNANFQIGTNSLRTPWTNLYSRPMPIAVQLLREGYESTNLSGAVPADHGVLLLGAQLKLPPPGFGLVDFTSDPPGATVFVDGQQTASRKPSVPQGPHTVEAVLPWPFGRTPAEQVNVKANETLAHQFYFPHGQVYIETNDPPQVQVFVDNRAVGLSPTNLSLPPGTYTFVFVAPGYESKTNLVTVADKASSTNRPALKPLDGFVEFASDPPGAQVTITTNLTAQLITNVPAPALTRLPLAPGVYKLTATYRDLRLLADPPPVRISAGQITNIGTFKFDYGTVVIDEIQPADVAAGATITADDGRAIRLRQPSFQKPNQAFAYMVRAPKYQPYSNSVTIASGTTNHLRVPLARLRAPVSLVSVPPGARFFTPDRVELQPGAGGGYALPWGPTDIVARQGRLSSITQSLDVVLEGSNSLAFRFSNYGRLVLGNLPSGAAVFANGELVGSPTNIAVYEPLASQVAYEVRLGNRSETVITNIVAGDNVLLAFLRKIYTNALGMSLVWVRGLPGTPEGGYVGKLEVSQKDFQNLMNANPSTATNSTSLPVQNVNAADAERFCEALTKRDLTNTDFPAGYAYALPSEAQWQYFAAGTATNGAILSESFSKARKSPEPVGSSSSAANKYEIQDLLGNVAELYHKDGAKTYGFLGGSYSTSIGRLASILEADGRFKSSDFTGPLPQIGFRVVLVPGPQATASK